MRGLAEHQAVISSIRELEKIKGIGPGIRKKIEERLVEEGVSLVYTTEAPAAPNSPQIFLADKSKRDTSRRKLSTVIFGLHGIHKIDPISFPTTDGVAASMVNKGEAKKRPNMGPASIENGRVKAKKASISKMPKIIHKDSVARVTDSMTSMAAAVRTRALAVSSSPLGPSLLPMTPRPPTVSATTHIHIAAIATKKNIQVMGTTTTPRSSTVVFTPPKLPSSYSAAVTAILPDSLSRPIATNSNLSQVELPRSPSKRKKRATAPKNPKEYIPAFRSGPYAMLIALYLEKMSSNSVGFLSRSDVVRLGQPYCLAPMDEGQFSPLSGAIKTLTTKLLVCKYSCPPKFSLSAEGFSLAEKLYNTGERRSSAPLPSFTILENDDADEIRRAQERASVHQVEDFVLEPDTYDIIIFVDTRETNGHDERSFFVTKLAEAGLKVEQKPLELGDFLWIARPKTMDNCKNFPLRLKLVLIALAFCCLCWCRSNRRCCIGHGD